MMESTHPVQPPFELFYNYSITTGRYDYIFPAANHSACFSLQAFLNQGIEYLCDLVHPNDYHKVKKHFEELVHLRPDQVHEGGI